MKISLETWLDQTAANDGVLAVGVLRTNGKCLCVSDGGKYPVEKIEDLLRQYLPLHAALPSAEFSPRWFTWQFEHGWFRFVPRPDTALLLLIVTPASAAASELDQLTADFLAWPPK